MKKECDHYGFCRAIHDLPVNQEGITHKINWTLKCKGFYRGKVDETLKCVGKEKLESD